MSENSPFFLIEQIKELELYHIKSVSTVVSMRAGKTDAVENSDNLQRMK